MYIVVGKLRQRIFNDHRHQIIYSFRRRRKYCLFGLQTDKSSDTSAPWKAYLLLFSKVPTALRRDRYSSKKYLYFFSAELRSVTGNAEKFFPISADAISPGCFVRHPRSPIRLAVLPGFTRHEIGRPNKAQTVVPFSSADADDAKTRASRRR